MKINGSQYWRLGRWQVEWHPDGKDRWQPLSVRMGWEVPHEWREWTVLGERLILVRLTPRRKVTK